MRLPGQVHPFSKHFSRNDLFGQCEAIREKETWAPRQAGERVQLIFNGEFNFLILLHFFRRGGDFIKLIKSLNETHGSFIFHVFCFEILPDAYRPQERPELPIN